MIFLLAQHRSTCRRIVRLQGSGFGVLGLGLQGLRDTKEGHVANVVPQPFQPLSHWRLPKVRG